MKKQERYPLDSNDIDELYRKLEDADPAGGYVSRATIFMNALNEGRVDKDAVHRAREYYGRLWNYTGD